MKEQISDSLRGATHTEVGKKKEACFPSRPAETLDLFSKCRCLPALTGAALSHRSPASLSPRLARHIGSTRPSGERCLRRAAPRVAAGSRLPRSLRTRCPPSQVSGTNIDGQLLLSPAAVQYIPQEAHPLYSCPLSRGTTGGQPGIKCCVWNYTLRCSVEVCKNPFLNDCFLFFSLKLLLVNRRHGNQQFVSNYATVYFLFMFDVLVFFLLLLPLQKRFLGRKN